MKDKVKIFILAILTFVFMNSCKRALLTAPGSATLVVTVNPAVIPLGGQAVVKVVGYKASGTTLPDGTVIFFSTDIGSIESRKETINGEAEAFFQSNDNRSGEAIITVTSGSATTIPDKITISIGSAALNSLSISANPAIIPIGSTFSYIRVIAYDKSLNTLSNIPVILTTDAGELNSNGSAINTDANGEAEDLLKTTDTANVTASSGEIEASVIVSVESNEAPNASFIYSPSYPIVGEIVYFNASGSSDADGTIVAYEWDFGDGHTNYGQTTAHNYTNIGTYTVMLVVQDDKGSRVNTSQTISISMGNAPTASFIYSPSSPAVDETVYFNASNSTDSDGTIVSYDWDLGDGASASGQTITHKYESNGTYTVMLVVTDDSGNTGSTSQTISIEDNEDPKAEFFYSPTEPVVNEDIHFNASDSYDPDGTIVSYEWDFGDNTTASGQTVVHQYSSRGNYEVYLRVTDNSGNTNSTSNTVNVSDNEKPDASFVYSPSDPIVNEDIYFNASESSDPDGTIVSYDWDFGDSTTAEGRTITHQYNIAGSYTVMLVVTDDHGNTSSDSKTITVDENQNPTASFTYSPENPVVDQQVNFNASGSTDSDGTIVSYKWDFGDGRSGSGEQVLHRYTDTGTYTVVLVVTDNSGNSDSVNKTVTVVDNTSPTASFTYSPSTPTTSDSITFNASASSDPDGNITSYSWDFGDSNTDSGVIVYHQYTTADTYTVWLTVTDNNGNTHSTSRTVMVN